MRLIQERYRKNAWRMMVACILLNRSYSNVVDPILKRLIRRYPTPCAMASASPVYVYSLIHRTGLAEIKTKRLIDMSRAWLEGRSITDLPGVGRYALDSYRIFVHRDHTIRPTDRMLKKYLTAKGVRL